MKKKFISLFSGCGGFDIGFIEAGFKCLSAFDNDKIAIEAYSNYIDSDIKECDLSEYISIDQFKNVDVVIAGPPCQGFSTAGKRRYNDPRNHLLIRAVEISLSINPKVIILENVNGVVAGKHKRYWDKAQKMLQKNYQVEEFLFNTKDFGLAQIRKRRLLIAWKINKRPEFLFPNKAPLTLKHALSKMDDSLPNHKPEFLAIDSSLYLIAKKIEPGQKLSNVRGGKRSIHTWDIPEVYGHVTSKEKRVLEALLKLRRRKRVRKHGDADPVAIKVITDALNEQVEKSLKSLIKKKYVRKIGNKYDLTNTFNGKFKRLCWDDPAPTVITRFGSPRYFLHPDYNPDLVIQNK